jgi:hypothetical protein
MLTASIILKDLPLCIFVPAVSGCPSAIWNEASYEETETWHKGYVDNIVEAVIYTIDQNNNYYCILIE